MKVGVRAKPCSVLAGGDLAAEPVVAHVEHHQQVGVHLIYLSRNRAGYLVVVQVHKRQIDRECHVAQVKYKLIPTQIHLLCRLPCPEQHRGITRQLVAGQIDGSPLRHPELGREIAGKVVVAKKELRRGRLGEVSEGRWDGAGEAVS